MRTVFDNQKVQEELKTIFEKYNCDYVVTDYWDEFVGFLKNPEATFGDLPNFLLDAYSIDGKKLSDIVVDMLVLFNRYAPGLSDFFRVKTIKELKSQLTAEQDKSLVGGDVGSQVMTNRSDRGRGHSTVQPSKSNFYFSPEDEEEIRKISKQSTTNGQQNMDAIYDQVAEDILKKISSR